MIHLQALAAVPGTSIKSGDKIGWGHASAASVKVGQKVAAAPASAHQAAARPTSTSCCCAKAAAATGSTATPTRPATSAPSGNPLMRPPSRPARPPLLTGTIANPDPDGLTVLLDDLDAGLSHRHEWGPCSFTSRGRSLPARGDRCIVGFDETGDPVVLWWDGSNQPPVPRVNSLREVRTTATRSTSSPTRRAGRCGTCATTPPPARRTSGSSSAAPRSPTRSPPARERRRPPTPTWPPSAHG